MFTLHQMSAFECVARSGSLTQAAATLGVSQPALSRTIRLLEAELGVQLLFRTGRGVELTEGGQVFLDFCRETLDNVRAVRLKLEELSTTLQGSARIAMPTGIASMTMAPFVTRFNELFPVARIHVSEAFTGDIVRRLSTGAVDVGVIYTGPASQAISRENVLGEDIYLVGPPDAAAVQVSEIGLHEVLKLPLILPTRQEGVRGLLDRAISDLGQQANVVIELDATVSLLDLIRQEKGYGLFPYCVVKQEVESGALQASRIVDPCLTRDIAIATTSVRPLSPVARQAASLLRASLLKEAKSARWSRTPSGVPAGHTTPVARSAATSSGP